MAFLKCVPKGFLCLKGDVSTHHAAWRLKGRSPTLCMSLPAHSLVQTPSLTRKMCCDHHRGREQLLQGGVYCQGSPGNKKRKRPIKAFPALRSHVLPLILFSESVCLPHTNVSPHPPSPRTERSFLVVKFTPFPNSVFFNEKNELKCSVTRTEGCILRNKKLWLGWL